MDDPRDFETALPARLAVLCVGTGRDGTMSLNAMIQNSFAREGRGRHSEHEWAAVDFYMNFCAFRETGEAAQLDAVRARLRACPVDALVGNGYAPILPQIAEVAGRGLILIHLKRRDRDAFVRSFIENIKLFPQNHKYYSDDPSAQGKRIAAFHFGESTEEEWNAWPLEQRVCWYYDKTHELINTYSDLFDTTIYLETERLNEKESRSALAQALNLEIVPETAHINRHIAVEGLSDEDRLWVHHYLMAIDPNRLARDDAYGIEHFFDVYMRRARGALVSPDPEIRAKALATLKSVENLVARESSALAELDTLFTR